VTYPLIHGLAVKRRLPLPRPAIIGCGDCWELVILDPNINKLCVAILRLVPPKLGLRSCAVKVVGVSIREGSACGKKERTLTRAHFTGRKSR
jgi:hypothetical protein